MKNPILLALRCCMLLSFLFNFISQAQNNKSVAPKQKSLGNQVDVYVSGGWYDKKTGERFAAYYKNAEPVVLRDGPRSTNVVSSAKSIAVNGNDVYVVGNAYDANSKDIAAYWKNQKYQPLPIKTDEYGNVKTSYAWGVELTGTDVNIFVTQNPTIENGFYYLKNGQEVNIPDIPTSGTIRSHGHFISGNDVYLIDQGGEAAYWKNGEKVVLDNTMRYPDFVQISSIFVSGNDVYVSGFKGYTSKGAANTNRNMALYWKNGQEVILSTGTGRYGTRNTGSIYVSGNDVYVGGMSQDPETGYAMAVYWKNGQEYVLSKGPNFNRVDAIVASGNDVYAAGQHDSKGVYWKNGQEIALPDCFEATDIAVSKGNGTVNKEILSNNDDDNAIQIIEPKNYTVFSHFPRSTKIAWTAVANATEYEVIIEYASTPGNGHHSFDEAVNFYPYISGKTKAKAVTFDGAGAQVHRYKIQAINNDKIISATDWFFIDYLH